MGTGLGCRGVALLVTVPLAWVFGEAARADTVELTNGYCLENVRVEDAGKSHVAVTRPGVRLVIRRSEVRSIRRSETPEETFGRLVQEAEGDPEGLAAAARFARENSLGERAREVDAMAADARLERILDGVDRDDAEALYQAAARAAEAGLPRAAVERILALVLLADPEHARAHRAFGESLFEGRWLADAEVERRRAERRAEEMREQGLVLFDSEWVTPDAKRFEETRRELAAALEAARTLKQELDAALAEAREAAARGAAREKALAAREAELDRREERLLAAEAALADRARHVDSGPYVVSYPYYPAGSTTIITRARCRPRLVPSSPAPKGPLHFKAPSQPVRPIGAQPAGFAKPFPGR